MEFKEEHVAFRRVVSEFADAEIASHAREWDRDRRFPLDAVERIGALCLFGLPFDGRYGGSGSDFTTLGIAIEELARVDQSIAITLEAAVRLEINPIAEAGTEAQRGQWMPDLIAGGSATQIFAEPASSTTPSSPATTAMPRCSRSAKAPARCSD